MWFEIYLDNENKWRWRLRQGNYLQNEIIATSHQGHYNRLHCENEVYAVQQTNGFTPIMYV